MGAGSTTSKGRYTPGPWRIVRASDYTGEPEDTTIYSIDAANGETVYYTESGYFRPEEADARLIAAAPEMAELLRLVADYQDSAWAGDAEAQRSAFALEARALLARIEGEV